MSEFKSIFRTPASVLAAIGLLCFTSCSSSQNDAEAERAAAEAEKKAARQATFENIKSAHRMVFATMTITKAVRTDRTAWYKVGQRVAVYSYDTYMDASVDLSSLSPDDIVWNDSDSTVTVTLPPVVTSLSGRDPQLRLDYENIGVFRSEISSEERATMKEQANAELRREVAENPVFRENLTAQAREKARQWLTALLGTDGWKVNVNFNNNPFETAKDR